MAHELGEQPGATKAVGLDRARGTGRRNVAGVAQHGNVPEGRSRADTGYDMSPLPAPADLDVSLIDDVDPVGRVSLLEE